MNSSPSDVVREAAKEDSKTSVETWGPEAFARRTRTKIHNFGAPLPPWEDKTARPTPAAKGIPKSINIILLGPTGSGKSSLIYTWWRALSGSVTCKEEFLEANVHDSFLQRLKVGWNAQDGASSDGASSLRRRKTSALISSGTNGSTSTSPPSPSSSSTKPNKNTQSPPPPSSSSSSLSSLSSAALLPPPPKTAIRAGGVLSPRLKPPEQVAVGAGAGAVAATVDSGGQSKSAGGVGRVSGGLLAAVPRHGTTTLDAFQLQAPNPYRGSGGITVHDTKGQQFFTEEEERFAEQMLQGKVKEGSTLDRQNLKYWFMVGNFGFFSTTSLAASPHVVVLVFDVTLRSFQQMLRERESNELCQCYRKIVRRAAKQGHEVFAVLTHVDAYTPDEDSDADDDDVAAGGAENGEEIGEWSPEHSPEIHLLEGERRSSAEVSVEDGGESGFDREADMSGILSLWREELSQALSGEGMAVLPSQNVFAVENYHKGSASQNPVVDLASLECLENVIEAGSRYVDMRYQQQQEGCTVV